MKNFTQRIFGLMAFMLLAVSISAQPPFWSQDFDGGLPADWAAIEVQGDSMTASNWFHTTVGPTGTYLINPINSTSAANGWMIFDSDLNCSGAQEAWLVSPKLDLSDKDIVVLTFEQYYRKFGDAINVQVSTDSTVWTQYPLSQGIDDVDFGDGSADGALNPQVVNVNISNEAAGASSVWIAFQFLADGSTAGGVDPGCAYSWQIDDVGLIDYDPTPALDLALGDFFFPPLSFATPSSQIATDTMGFSGDVTNLGNSDATNVVLKAAVSNQAGDLLFVDSVVAAVIPVGTIDSTLIVPTLYPPATDLDRYTISYSLYSLDGDDADMSNNSASEDYVVTEDLWSKEDGETIAFRPGGGPIDYDIGNVYWTSNDWVETYFATTVNFNAATNAADGALNTFMTSIILVEIDEEEVLPGWDNFNTDDNYLTNPQLGIRSFELHQYTGGNFNMQTVNLNDFDLETPGVELKPGNRYILFASYENENNVVFHGFSEEINYFQISTVIYNAQWFLGGFGPEPAAVMRMTISISVDAEENLLPENVMTVYPNPVKDQLNLDLDFEKPELANVTLAHLNGQVIKIDILKNALNESRQYDVSDLPAGTYLIRVTTKEGSRTQKFVVVK